MNYFERHWRYLARRAGAWMVWRDRLSKGVGKGSPHNRESSVWYLSQAAGNVVSYHRGAHRWAWLCKTLSWLPFLS